MSSVIGVRFQRTGRVEYFDPGNVEAHVSDHVVVETDKGLEIAMVVIAPDQVVYSEVKEPLRPIVRKATQEDMQHGEELKARASLALPLAKE
jgi:cell fate regulator YaaT (PSP1 superfamily)